MYLSAARRILVSNVRISSIKDFKSASELDAKLPSIKSFLSSPNLELTGKPVVVLGNSPALKAVDLSPLKKVTTIGVNRICRVFEPSCVLITDPPVVDAEIEYLKKFKGKYLTWNKFKHPFLLNNSETRCFTLAPGLEPDKWVWPKKRDDPLIWQSTTPTYAMQLAALFEAKVIGILGVDLSAPSDAAKKQQTHFYGSPFRTLVCQSCSDVFPMHKVPIINGLRPCPRCKSTDMKLFHATGGGDWNNRNSAFFSKLESWAATFGTKVINLSPFSDTPIHKANLPKMTVEQFVNEFT